MKTTALIYNGVDRPPRFQARDACAQIREVCVENFILGYFYICHQISAWIPTKSLEHAFFLCFRRFGYERMDSSGLQEVRQLLHLTKDGDFLIVLATAEKLRPNIYLCAMGEGGQNGTEAIYRNVLGCL